ncbi:MAG TPA: 6-carboxytetrahydropterin synthase [Caulobacteraceae bacterium]|jgi:6-pyruvoyltetrahydropterin/6-carboxytetrahydropterin synthase
MTQFEITKAASFDAAHSLPGGPDERPYARLHGHSFRVEATLRGPAVGPVGWVADLAELDTALKAIAGELDHSLLNEHPGLESPTLEALCLYFAGKLAPDFPALRRITVSRPTVGETCLLEVG